ncbi:MAG: F0F1 ATP synthase subunit B [Verrucomicrobiae bacterium]|nr:F0F1 ATP synthase subunit B [Verrucomicrobiae bacterium]
MASKTTTGTEVPGGKPSFPPFDTSTFAPQLVWLALTFGLLYFVLSRVVLPRIADVIDERANRIKRDLDAAERLKVETDKAIATYEDALGAAKTKANQIAAETRAALTADTDREKLSVESQLNARLAEAETRIAAMKTKALGSVNDIAVSTASAIVGRLIGDEPTADEMKRALAPVAGE